MRCKPKHTLFLLRTSMLERTGKSASDYSRNIALLNCRNMASELLLTHVVDFFMSENYSFYKSIEISLQS